MASFVFNHFACFVGETQFLLDESRVTQTQLHCCLQSLMFVMEESWPWSSKQGSSIFFYACRRTFPPSLMVVFRQWQKRRACTGILSRDYGSAPTHLYSIVDSPFRLSSPEKINLDETAFIFRVRSRKQSRASLSTGAWAFATFPPLCPFRWQLSTGTSKSLMLCMLTPVP